MLETHKVLYWLKYNSAFSPASLSSAQWQSMKKVLKHHSIVRILSVLLQLGFQPHNLTSVQQTEFKIYEQTLKQ